MTAMQRPCFLAAVGGLTVLLACTRSPAEDSLAKLRYPLARADGIKTPTFEVDFSEVADDEAAKAWVNEAKAVAQEWFPIVCRFLATDNWTPPETVRLVLKKELGAPAATTGGTILINANWIRDNPRDFGMVIHEMTHVIQDYRGGSPRPGWLVEGIADYIRYWKFEPESPRHRISAKASYRDGYGTTGAFLAWLVWQYDERIVHRLDEALRADKYSDAIFRDATGKDLDALWAEFLERRKAEG